MPIADLTYISWIQSIHMSFVRGQLQQNHVQFSSHKAIRSGTRNKQVSGIIDAIDGDLASP